MIFSEKEPNLRNWKYEINSELWSNDYTKKTTTINVAANVQTYYNANVFTGLSIDIKELYLRIAMAGTAGGYTKLISGYGSIVCDFSLSRGLFLWKKSEGIISLSYFFNTTLNTGCDISIIYK